MDASEHSVSGGLGRSEFYDNASLLLHGDLGKKGYREVALDSPLRARGDEYGNCPRDERGRVIAVLPDPSAINAGAYDPDVRYITDGEVLPVEDPTALVPESAHGDQRRVTPATLQREGLKIKGGSSKSGRRVRDEKQKRSGRRTGPAWIEDEPRSQHVSARVTTKTRSVLAHLGKSTSDVLAELASAILEGRAYNPAIDQKPETAA